MRPPRLLLIALVAAVLAAIAIFNLWQSGAEVQRSVKDAGGVPVELFEPTASASQAKPAVVVAHGFSGNRQLMYGFGYTLARNGYVAALIDFAGHGASRERLPGGSGDAGYRILASNLSSALEVVRQIPSVDPDRVALLGHSMGAGAVVRYAAEHPEVPATVAVSLGGMGSQLPPRPDNPRNLLLLVGANEFAGFLDGSTAALQIAYPGAVAGQTYGDFQDGSARRLSIPPGVEHISILFSPEAYRETVSWLNAALAGSDAPGTPAGNAAELHIDARIGWVLLLYAAAAVGFYPLSRVLLRRRTGADEPSAPVAAPAGFMPGWKAALLSAGGGLLAPALMLVFPYQWMPLSVGNYAGGYFLLYGAVLIAGLAAAKRLGPHGWGDVRRLAAPVLILAAYALLTFGLTAHLTWTNFALAGERLWMGGVLFAFLLSYFWADEMLVWRYPARARAALYALTKAILLISLAAAIFAFRAPFFLLLLIPVMLALFAWHGLYSHWLFRFSGRAWPGAVVNASVLAWMIAATFALGG